MDWNIEQISKTLGGKLIGKPLMKTKVCEVILFLPEDLIEYVTKQIWFMSSSDEAWGYTFSGSDLQEKHLIFLSDELFRADSNQIKYTILHEIGHVILQHKNSIRRKQTQSEIDRQERGADQFARKYLHSK